MKEKRELMLFILNEEGGNEGENSKENTEEIGELKKLDLTKRAEIELRTITSFSSKGTMKLMGMVKGKAVIVLIDSGATHNFIH